MPHLISSICSVLCPPAGTPLPGVLLIVNDNCYVLLSPQDLLVLEEQEVHADKDFTVESSLFVDCYVVSAPLFHSYVIAH